MTGTTGSMMRPIFILLLVQAAEGPGEEENKLTCDSRDATVGEDVTLSCHFEKHRDVTDESIVWRFNGNIDVLVYRNKGVSPADQAEQFRGRASQGSSWNPAEGKVPVEISSFKETDAGEYTCTVGTRSRKVSCSTTLNVLQVHEQVNSPPADQLNLNRAPGSDEQGRNRIGIGTVIVIVIAFSVIGIAVIAIAIGVFMIWPRYKNKEKPRKTKEKKRLLGLDSAAECDTEEETA